MGELKNLREQQDNILARAKEVNRKIYLAGLGAYSKVEGTSGELFDKYADAGATELGEAAEGKPKALLAGRGLLKAAGELVESAPEKRKELYQRFLDAGRKERGEKAEATSEYLLAGIGAVLTAREESQKLFNDLVSAGEQRA